MKAELFPTPEQTPVKDLAVSAGGWFMYDRRRGEISVDVTLGSDAYILKDVISQGLEQYDIRCLAEGVAPIPGEIYVVPAEDNPDRIHRLVTDSPQLLHAAISCAEQRAVGSETRWHLEGILQDLEAFTSAVQAEGGIPAQLGGSVPAVAA